jgi:hypothetical protein
VQKKLPDNFSWLFLVAAYAAFFYVNACKPIANNENIYNLEKNVVRDSILKQRVMHFNAIIYPKVKELIASGDMITRMGNDITSILFSKTNSKDPSFSHCGIVSFENDSAFVYHCIGGEFNPDQKMKREWLYDFINPENSIRAGVFTPEMTKIQKSLLINRIKHLYKSGLIFDMEFNLRTDDKQYCSEMVAKSISYVLGSGLNWLNITNHGGQSFISVDNLYLNELMKEKGRYNY